MRTWEPSHFWHFSLNRTPLFSVVKKIKSAITIMHKSLCFTFEKCWKCVFRWILFFSFSVLGRHFFTERFYFFVELSLKMFLKCYFEILKQSGHVYACSRHFRVMTVLNKIDSFSWYIRHLQQNNKKNRSYPNFNLA